MNPETREFLDTLACIAQANLNYLFEQDGEELNLDDQGSQVLMSAFLQLYQQSVGEKERTTTPTPLAYSAARACCAMRRELESRPREVWGDEEHGLFTLMLGYMFMFKQLYVVRG